MASETQAEAMRSAGIMVMGFLWQRALHPQHLPPWAAWIVFVLAAAALWYWATPDVRKYRKNWRLLVFSIFNFVMGSKGASSTDAG